MTELIRYQQCEKCLGTGIRIGPGERDGLGVVCQTCIGTGREEITYTPFSGRVRRKDITKVISAGSIRTLRPEDTAGGVSYADFLLSHHAPFARGKEVREYECPATLFRRDFFAECKEYITPGTRWSDCPLYKNGDWKKICWPAFDKLHTEEINNFGALPRRTPSHSKALARE